MAAPRIFVSSTYYDLKHLRSALEAFIEGLGYQAILSEKGEIAYSPDAPLDESCYRAAKQADIMVLIIGGRYGSVASADTSMSSDDFFDRYDSITKKELEAAASENIPCYILVERAVYDEYQTFRRNRENEEIKYAHVDSVNIFELLDSILSMPKNNPTFQFDRYQDIEDWLKTQWASLFQELVGRLSESAQLTSLASEVLQLTEANKTMRRYLEEVMSTVSPDVSKSLIKEESARLNELRIENQLGENRLVKLLAEEYSMPMRTIRDAFTNSKSVKQFVGIVSKVSSKKHAKEMKSFLDDKLELLIQDINQCREILGLGIVDWD